MATRRRTPEQLEKRRANYQKHREKRAEYFRLYYQANKARANANRQARRKKNHGSNGEWKDGWIRRYLACKEAVVNVYTNGEGTCRWCGQGDIDVLCIDHINDDGKEHRSQSSTRNICMWIISKGYPEGFQVLCANCNLKKEVLRRRKLREVNA